MSANIDSIDSSLSFIFSIETVVRVTQLRCTLALQFALVSMSRNESVKSCGNARGMFDQVENFANN